MALSFLALSLVGRERRFPMIGNAAGPGGSFALDTEICHSAKSVARSKTSHSTPELFGKKLSKKLADIVERESKPGAT